MILLYPPAQLTGAIESSGLMPQPARRRAADRPANFGRGPARSATGVLQAPPTSAGPLSRQLARNTGPRAGTRRLSPWLSWRPPHARTERAEPACPVPLLAGRRNSDGLSTASPAFGPFRRNQTQDYPGALHSESILPCVQLIRAEIRSTDGL